MLRPFIAEASCTRVRDVKADRVSTPSTSANSGGRMLESKPYVSDFAQTVKQQVDIVKVIEGYIRLRNAGAQRFKGLCPFHKEKTPSFSVNGEERSSSSTASAARHRGRLRVCGQDRERGLS